MTAMELFPVKVPAKRGIANRRKYAVNFLSWISYKIMTSCKFLNLFFPHYYVKFYKIVLLQVLQHLVNLTSQRTKVPQKN